MNGHLNSAFLLLACVSLLSSCGSARGKLEPVPDDAAVVETHSVVVVTSRAPVDGPPYYSNQRPHSTHFSLMEISVPPDRKVGTAPFPTSNKADPRKYFLVTSHECLDGDHEFFRAIQGQATSRHADKRQGAVLVHGYNSRCAEAVVKEAQFTYDPGRAGINILYSWPSAANQTNQVSRTLS